MPESLISLRPIEAEDREFLCQLYASTREEELAPVPWSATQKEAFLRFQFNVQHRYYQEHYAGASFQVILRDGRPAGRLYVARWAEEIRIVDIALLPEHRQVGIGSSLLKEILAEGTRTGKPVTIHVEQFNPALRLYERLGFRRKGEVGVYFLLEFSPAKPAVAEAAQPTHEPPSHSHSPSHSYSHPCCPTESGSGSRSRSENGNQVHGPDGRPELEVQAFPEPQRRVPSRRAAAATQRAELECGAAPASSGVSCVHLGSGNSLSMNRSCYGSQTRAPERASARRSGSGVQSVKFLQRILSQQARPLAGAAAGHHFVQPIASIPD